VTDSLYYSITTFSLICQGTSTMRQRSGLFGLRVKLLPVSVNLSLTTQSTGILLSTFLKDTSSKLAGLFSTLSL